VVIRVNGLWRVDETGFMGGALGGAVGGGVS